MFLIDKILSDFIFESFRVLYDNEISIDNMEPILSVCDDEFTLKKMKTKFSEAHEKRILLGFFSYEFL